MNIFKSLFSVTLSGLVTLAFTAEAQEILVRAPSGEMFLMEVEPDEPFFSVLERVKLHAGCDHEVEDVDPNVEQITENSPFILDYSMLGSLQAKWNGGKRDYSAELSKGDKDDIKLILTTMAKYASNDPTKLFRLWRKEKDLKQAGDRIEKIHPLRFLSHVFTNEELKAAMAAVRKCSIVWKKYYEGFNESMEIENKNENLTPYITDFATFLSINSASVTNIVGNKDWAGLIDYLIESIPRTGNTRIDF